MKIISTEGVLYPVASQIRIIEGKVRLPLVSICSTRVYCIYRRTEGNHSDWKGYPKSP